MLKFKENELVYTSFGYGTILTLEKKICEPIPLPEKEKDAVENSENIIPIPPSSLEEIKENEEMELTYIKLKWGGTVSLPKKLIKKKITVHIKTFYATRKIFTIEVDISTSVQQLKNMILDKSAEQSKTLYNLRLIYPMGSIQELSVGTNTLEMYKIPDQAKLVLIAQTTFFFDPSMKATGIKLSNNNLTAIKTGEVDYQSVLGNLSISSGRCYWEIKIEKTIDEEDLFIGIARRNINLYIQPSSTNLFWGYLCLCAKKVGPDGAPADYGYSAKVGDIIGVLLEFRASEGTLSFYRNGARCGVAFSGLNGTFYPIVSLLSADVQISLDPKAPMPLN